MEVSIGSRKWGRVFVKGSLNSHPLRLLRSAAPVLISLKSSHTAGTFSSLLFAISSIRISASNPCICLIFPRRLSSRTWPMRLCKISILSFSHTIWWYRRSGYEYGFYSGQPSQKLSNNGQTIPTNQSSGHSDRELPLRWNHSTGL